MYTRDCFIKDCEDLFERTDGNNVEIPGIGVTRLYDMPIFGFAAASDSIFETYKVETIIGSHFMEPYEWLPAAKTVVSLFLPTSETVRKSNRAKKGEPSTQWLYARVEGQEFINSYMKAIMKLLEGKGIQVCVPSLDKRFHVQYEPTIAGNRPDFHADSRWSERHAAYACGLGTFGLSKGLITEKGMAGRFASLMISEEWEPSQRRYTGIDDYCIKCGACIRNCPAEAISFEHGKNNVLCKAFQDGIYEKYPPRYGCGKCQVGVPCENMAPGLRKNSD